MFNCDVEWVLYSRQWVARNVIKGLLTRREQAVLIFVAASIVAGSCFLWWEQHRRTGIAVIHNDESAVVPPVNDVSTFSVSLQGTGDLTVGTV